MDNQGEKTRKAVIALGALAAVVAYCTFCMATDSMPRCPFKWITGFDCPGCGSQRAIRALIAGHPLEAWSYNLILPPMLAYLAAILVLPLIKGGIPRKIYERLTSPGVISAIAAVVILWWIVRNLI